MKTSQPLAAPTLSSSNSTEICPSFRDSSILLHPSVDLNRTTASRLLTHLSESPGSDYVLVGDVDEINQTMEAWRKDNPDNVSSSSHGTSSAQGKTTDTSPSIPWFQVATANGYTWKYPTRSAQSHNGHSAPFFSSTAPSKPTVSVNRASSSIRPSLGQSLSSKISNFFQTSEKPPNSTSFQAARSLSNATKSDLFSTLTKPSSASARTTSTSSLNEDHETVQNRLRSLWNNVKYGWSLPLSTHFDSHSPIYFLGVVYRFNSHADTGHRFFDSQGNTFYLDFVSRLWFSYRHGFPSLPITSNSQQSATLSPKKSLVASLGLRLGANTSRSDAFESSTSLSATIRTSDSGWGCMLRCGQMLMAQALLLHFLSRTWRINQNDLTASPSRQSHEFTSSVASSSRVEKDMHRTIIRWFGDNDTPSSPFSVHNLLKLSGKEVGDWYGPAAVCYLLDKALHSAHRDQPLLQQVVTYVASDRQIYVQDVRRLFCIHQSHHSCVTLEDLKASEDYGDCCSRAVILLIPLYLGNAKGFQEEIYATPLLRMFRDPQCIGFIGGKPKHSLYFVGSQDRELIYLDPHFSQPFVEVSSDSFPSHTFHCKHPRKLPVSRIDPCGASGFYCRSATDLYSLLQRIRILRSENASAFPLVEVLPGQRPVYSDLRASNTENSAESHTNIGGSYHSLLTSQSQLHATDLKTRTDSRSAPSGQQHDQSKDNGFVLL